MSYASYWAPNKTTRFYTDMNTGRFPYLKWLIDRTAIFLNVICKRQRPARDRALIKGYCSSTQAMTSNPPTSATRPPTRRST